MPGRPLRDPSLPVCTRARVCKGLITKWQVHDRITKNHGLVAYSDASWHDSDELGYDMFGYVIYFAGGPIAFTSKRIKVVAKSSAEAEYATAAYTCMELTFVRNI